MTRKELLKAFYSWAKEKYKDEPLSFLEVDRMLECFIAGYSLKDSKEIPHE